jgi:hypothetical protein
MPRTPTESALAVAFGFLAVCGSVFAGQGVTPRQTAEMRVAEILASTPWEELIDALEEQPPGLVGWKQTATFPWPTFTVGIGDGLGTIEVRRVGRDHRGSPLQVFYTLPTDTCIGMDAVSKRWPSVKPFHGPMMPGADSEPKDGLQLIDVALHRRILYLVDPERLPCLSEVLINDTNFHWGMSREDVEKLRKK